MKLKNHLLGKWIKISLIVAVAVAQWPNVNSKYQLAVCAHSIPKNIHTYENICESKKRCECSCYSNVYEFVCGSRRLKARIQNSECSFIISMFSIASQTFRFGNHLICDGICFSYVYKHFAKKKNEFSGVHIDANTVQMLTMNLKGKIIDQYQIGAKMWKIAGKRIKKMMGRARVVSAVGNVIQHGPLPITITDSIMTVHK